MKIFLTKLLEAVTIILHTYYFTYELIKKGIFFKEKYMYFYFDNLNTQLHFLLILWDSLSPEYVSTN